MLPAVSLLMFAIILLPPESYPLDQLPETGFLPLATFLSRHAFALSGL